ncbi:uncharacterized protein I303_101184 [Kwoniella dejecticola CBS 10117]|uniref:Major facilitator superfamily (MFS) profile domain-containing protein n=1 Tax=Kwoniella dejecticola CBS 10117 TaxID=1296121 RepID=A0AAJ8KJK7_9TREE
MTTGERRPLLQSQDSGHYASTPKVDVPVIDTDKLSYNKVGLSVNRFLNAFDGTVVATLLGPISSSFNATNMASWLGTSYEYSLYHASLTSTAIGNFLCAIAPNMEFLIAARALAGMGGGGLSTVGSTIMSDIVPITHRGIYQGFGNLAFGGGMG